MCFFYTTKERKERALRQTILKKKRAACCILQFIMSAWKRTDKGGWHTTADGREVDEGVISKMLTERTEAKAAKNYTLADSLAKELQAQVSACVCVSVCERERVCACAC